MRSAPRVNARPTVSAPKGRDIKTTPFAKNASYSDPMKYTGFSFDDTGLTGLD